MVKNTGKDYREANRARLKRYYDKQKDLGKKRVSILLSGDTQALLVAERDELNISASDIIEQALNERFNPTRTIQKQVAVSAKTEPKLIEDPQGSDEIPDCHGKELTQDELDNILIKVDEMYPKGGKGNPQYRADALNNAGVCLKDKKGEWISVEWDKKKASNNINMARCRLKKK